MASNFSKWKYNFS